MRWKVCSNGILEGLFPAIDTRHKTAEQKVECCSFADVADFGHPFLGDKRRVISDNCFVVWFHVMYPLPFPNCQRETEKTMKLYEVTK